MTRVYLGIGTNVGDRHAHLAHARERLDALPRTRVAAFSDAYETDPVGPVAMGRFLNAAACVETELDPLDLLTHLHAIENDAGRKPEDQRIRWGPRELDIDILLFGEAVISEDELVVPHPLMHERWFVLKPLADICPGCVHPLLEMTVADLLRYVESGRPLPQPDRT